MSKIECLTGENIPKPLLEISDPPKKLYMRGELPSHYEYTYLTIVGSRKYTDYGLAAAERIVSGLAGYPIVIVSGLALGMDAIAHNAALKNGILTVAIPGSGLDDSVLYPATNKNLGKKILESGGCLLSEYEPDFKATQWSFPRRNRLMAGISRATLVIEAGLKSGSLITANLAMDYNRDVCALPGSIFSEVSLGTNELIRDGAIPISSSQDIINALGLDYINDIEKQDLDLSDEEKEILDGINNSINKDDLIRALGKPVSEVNILLSSLELNGLIRIDGAKLTKTI